MGLFWTMDMFSSPVFILWKPELSLSRTSSKPNLLSLIVDKARTSIQYFSYLYTTKTLLTSCSFIRYKASFWVPELLLSLPITVATGINVTSFSSIPYYSNVRLISKMYLAQNFHSITLDIHASTFNPCFVYFLWEQAWFGKQHKDAV